MKFNSEPLYNEPARKRGVRPSQEQTTEGSDEADKAFLSRPSWHAAELARLGAHGGWPNKPFPSLLRKYKDRRGAPCSAAIVIITGTTLMYQPE